MEYKINLSRDSADAIEKFHQVIDNLRENVRIRIPQGPREDIDIVYTDEYEDFEYSINYVDFMNIVDNKILTVLENIDRLETNKDTVEVINI